MSDKMAFDETKATRKKDGHQRVKLIERFSDDGVCWKFVVAVADDQTRFTPFLIEEDGQPVAVDPRVLDHSWHIEVLSECDIENY